MDKEWTEMALLRNALRNMFFIGRLGIFTTEATESTEEERKLISSSVLSVASVVKKSFLSAFSGCLRNNAAEMDDANLFAPRPLLSISRPFSSIPCPSSVGGRPFKLFLCLSLLLFTSPLEGRCLDCYSEESSYCTLPSPGEGSGMFSVFITALGFLHFYEQEGWAGAKIDFRDKGLYYDPQKGSNWWEYYFEPVVLGSDEEARERRVAHRQIHRFNKTGDRILSREEGSRLVQKYIKLKPALEKRINAFVDEHFKGNFVIGVHFRGTDKVKREAKPVPFEQVFKEIRSLISQLKTKDYKIFVATDEESFLQEVKREFKERVIFSDARRSSDGRAVHFASAHSYKTGEEAVIDCLLLSKTSYLLRTASNLSFCSGFFNPNLPIKLITPQKL